MVWNSHLFGVLRQPCALNCLRHRCSCGRRQVVCSVPPRLVDYLSGVPDRRNNPTYPAGEGGQRISGRKLSQVRARRGAGSDPSPRGRPSANRSTTVITGAASDDNHGHPASYGSSSTCGGRADSTSMQSSSVAIKYSCSVSRDSCGIETESTPDLCEKVSKMLP